MTANELRKALEIICKYDENAEICIDGDGDLEIDIFFTLLTDEEKDTIYQLGLTDISNLVYMKG